MTYCYSFDKETFIGDYETAEEAIAEAREEGKDEGHTGAWYAEVRYFGVKNVKRVEFDK